MGTEAGSLISLFFFFFQKSSSVHFSFQSSRTRAGGALESPSHTMPLCNTCSSCLAWPKGAGPSTNPSPRSAQAPPPWAGLTAFVLPRTLSRPVRSRQTEWQPVIGGRGAANQKGAPHARARSFKRRAAGAPTHRLRQLGGVGVGGAPRLSSRFARGLARPCLPRP